MHQQEEELTRYESKDQSTLAVLQLEGNVHRLKELRSLGWEFKIVRAKTDYFRDPEIFQQLCREEELAGWILLEKLDDRRVRFKRPIALRELLNLEDLPFDPYRCYYEPPTAENWFQRVGKLGVGVVTLAAMTVPACFTYILVSRAIAQAQNSNSLPVAEPKPLSFPEKPITPRSSPDT